MGQLQRPLVAVLDISKWEYLKEAFVFPYFFPMEVK